MSQIDGIVRNLRVMLRADMIMAELTLRQIAVKGGLFALAGLVAGFGAIMLGIAGFIALEEVYGPVCAALITGGAAVGLALLLVVIALCIRPGIEMQAAAAVHNQALAAVSQELDATAASAQRFANLVGNPLGGLTGLLVPVGGLILRWLRRRRG